MFGLFRRKSNYNTAIETDPVAPEKKYIHLTGTLENILRPGMPALYLYNGNLIRTSTVQRILEAAPGYVSFETRNSIYTIAYERAAGELKAAA